MSNPVTAPILLDSTGQDMAGALGDIASALEVKTLPATTDRLGVVKPDGTSIHVTEDGTISAALVLVAIPVVATDSFTYNGSQQGIVFSSISTSDVIITGASATNAGNYTCTVTLKNPSAMWGDGTNAPKTFPWTIAKAQGSISVSPASIVLNSQTTSASVGVTVTGDGGVTLTSSDTTCATVSPSVLTTSGNVTVTGLGKTGSATITATLAEGTNFLGATATCAVDCQFVPLKTFAAATDSEIAQMVAAADAGQIDLYKDCGWRVGQEHTVSLGAIAASGSYDGTSWTVGEAHSATTVTLVLMHRGLYQLVDAVKDKSGATRTTCSFVVGLKNAVDATYGYMNSTNTNSGSWNGSARRGWCNGGFRQAIPEVLRAAFKKCKVLTAQTYNGSTNQTSQDYFFLAAAAEVFKGDSSYGQGGTAGQQTGYSNLTEFNALTRFTYYATTSNRVKKGGDGGSACLWWERSPFYDDGRAFCNVNTNGTAYRSLASGTFGLAPVGCL